MYVLNLSRKELKQKAAAINDNKRSSAATRAILEGTGGAHRCGRQLTCVGGVAGNFAPTASIL